MATSPDHPSLTYVQASGYTPGRPLGRPLWIVIHDMEADELPDTAEATANYFATGAGGRDVSSHYCCDSNSVIQCVLLADTAWTVGNTQGNAQGINYELAGFAAQTREQWLDDYSMSMFRTLAPILAADAQTFGIPLVYRDAAALQQGLGGVTSHWELGRAFGGTDHTDPGPNFPWDVFLAIMSGEDGGDVAKNILVKKGTQVWLADGTFRRNVTAFVKLDVYDPADNSWSLGPCAVRDLWQDRFFGPLSNNGRVFDPGEGANLDAYGVDIATLGGGGLTPHVHPLVGNTGNAVPSAQ